jgi:di/tricarboxylate transporter
MPWEGWFTLILLAGVLYALAREIAGPDVVMLGAMAILMGMGAISPLFPSPKEIVGQFGNEGLVTVGTLFVVAAGLSQTGALSILSNRVLGNPTSIWKAQLRMMLPAAGISAFMNNTPVVAMFIPVIRDWSHKTGVPASKLYMPLSFATLLGGVCTLIGTSTNLVVLGLMNDSQRTDATFPTLGFWDLTIVGIPAAVAGMGYILLTSRWLLPRRIPSADFSTVPAHDSPTTPRRKSLAALSILIVMIGAMTLSTSVPIVTCTALAAAMMVLTRCCTPDQARRSIDWRTLLAIGASFGIGRAMETTGAADFVAGNMLGIFKPLGPWGVLVGVYLLTLLFTELITNNAAAALAFPIAKAAAAAMGVSFLPFGVVLAVAASAAFSTPIGYHTHLMVYGPGGYRFTDFIRFGLPLNFVVMVVVVAIAPIAFPF